MKFFHEIWFGKETHKEPFWYQSYNDYFSDWELKRWSEKDFDEIYSILDYCDDDKGTLKKYFLKNKKYTVIMSDVLRYCLLYKYGGLYVDHDVKLLSNSLRNIIESGDYNKPVFSKRITFDKFDKYFLYEYVDENNKKHIFLKGGYYIDVMYSLKDNIIFRKVLDEIIYRVNLVVNINKGDNPITLVSVISGQSAFCNALREFNDNNDFLTFVNPKTIKTGAWCTDFGVFGDKTYKQIKQERKNKK